MNLQNQSVFKHYENRTPQHQLQERQNVWELGGPVPTSNNQQDQETQFFSFQKTQQELESQFTLQSFNEFVHHQDEILFQTEDFAPKQHDPLLEHIEIKRKPNYLCAAGQCRKRPAFNFRGEKLGRFCAGHKVQGMVDVLSKKCEYHACETAAGYNYPGEARRFCAKHKFPGMIHKSAFHRCKTEGCTQRAEYILRGQKGPAVACLDHRSLEMAKKAASQKTCMEVGCEKSAKFNFQGTGVAKYCEVHQLAGMVLVGKRKVCAHFGCLKQPNFNYENLTPSLYCKTHKLPGMVYGPHIKCEHPRCSKQKAYNYPQLKRKPKYCSMHKLPGMVFVHGNLCKETGCRRVAHWNHKGQHQARFCRMHRWTGMVHLSGGKRRMTCEFAECPKLPCYNFLGHKAKRFCSAHKFPGMVNVSTRLCEAPGCIKQPSFNLEGLKSARFCRKHKQPLMVDVKKHNLCQHPEGCTSSSNWNYPGENKRRFCSTHKLPGMVNLSVKTIKKCEYRECDNLASFKLEGSRQYTHCTTHKLPGMVFQSKKRKRKNKTTAAAKKGKKGTPTEEKECEHQGCKKPPMYYFPGGSKHGRLCLAHRFCGMIALDTEQRNHCMEPDCKGYVQDGDKYCPAHCDTRSHLVPSINPKKCLSQGCQRRPSCNYRGEKAMLYCWEHKFPTMVNLRGVWLRCGYDECKRRAVYNFPSKQKAGYCYEHIFPGMVDFRTGLCQHQGCQRSALYNYLGEKQKKFCGVHRLPNMVNARYVNKCEAVRCGEKARCNYPGAKSARFCCTHMLPGMQNVGCFSVKECEWEGCLRRAYYNYRNARGKRFCKHHHLPGMVVKMKECEVEGCSTQASSNYPGIRSRRFCAVHRLPGMTDKKATATTKPICETVNCTKIASYNYFGKEKRPKFCRDHKSSGMCTRFAKYKRSTPAMCEQGCGKHASFNYAGEKKRRFCSKHSLPGMLNVNYSCNQKKIKQITQSKKDDNNNEVNNNEPKWL